MKTFLKIDYYVQTFVFAITVSTLLAFCIYEESWEKMFLFYWIIGGFQLASFLIRVYLNYPKSFVFNIYGIMLMPIWFGFASAFVDFEPGILFSVFRIIGAILCSFSCCFLPFLLSRNV